MNRLLLALGLATAIAAPALAQTGNPGGAINDNLGAMDYGVCRGTDPKCFHDWPRAKSAKLKVLLYTRTAGPRHANLGAPLGAGLNPPLGDDNVVQKGMLRLAQENGIDLDYTEDVTQMQRLVGYNAVIFFSTSRDNLDDGAKTALRQYMRAGGGFVGVHNAFGTLYNWPYYEGLLGGANFYDHGPAQTADVVIVDDKDVSTKGLPKRFAMKDEWYNLVPFPTKVRFLATVDETSYTAKPGEGEGFPPPRPGQPPRPPMAPSVVGKSPGHGTFHPVAWCQYYDGGKAWLTTLGHDPGVFAQSDADFAGAKAFQAMVVGAIKSVAGQEPFCR
ncbi:ThuA domain-containing protein [Caulobacter segnis]|uniref:ThuA domain-containing protein n=1 Tax=Caulobacter segnis TaxID=88688 RepID=UPI001CBDA39C|nr:ThuA domain-containing protein [Caulobacter segnis]UAL09506.1 ThuA domain-containing protein [Caulobacter segnis]